MFDFIYEWVWLYLVSLLSHTAYLNLEPQKGKSIHHLRRFPPLPLIPHLTLVSTGKESFCLDYFMCNYCWPSS